MKKKMLFAFVLIFYMRSQVSAQLRHYLSLNTVAYQNYFNKEKNEVYIDNGIWFFFPNLSYKIEKDKWGLEAFYNDDGVAYYHKNSNYPDGSPRIRQTVFSSNIGLVCHYTVLSKKYIKVNPMLGLVKTWYKQKIWQLGLHSGGWWDGYVDGYAESKLGMLLGMNVNVPLYKGIYFNTNLRYSRFLSAQYNKQNMIWEMGFGYVYQNREKKK